MRRLLLSHYNTKSLIQTSLAPCMGDGMVRIYHTGDSNWFSSMLSLIWTKPKRIETNGNVIFHHDASTLGNKKRGESENLVYLFWR